MLTSAIMTTNKIPAPAHTVRGMTTAAGRQAGRQVYNQSVRRVLFVADALECTPGLVEQRTVTRTMKRACGTYCAR